eukprot:8442224-Pyramimonas_sp.AAC.1
MKATVYGADGLRVPRGSTVLFCTCCGACSWGGTKSLCRISPKPLDVSVALRRQRGRAAKRLFPGWAPQYS